MSNENIALYVTGLIVLFMIVWNFITINEIKNKLNRMDFTQKDIDRKVHNLYVDSFNKPVQKKCTGNCGMNYCDENGCIERKRNLVNADNLVPQVSA
jgi:hypothetical protein